MAKAYRTTSSKALCTLTGITPIIIRTEVTVKQYNIRKTRRSQTPEIDNIVELKDWTHLAESHNYLGEGLQGPISTGIHKWKQVRGRFWIRSSNLHRTGNCSSNKTEAGQ